MVFPTLARMSSAQSHKPPGLSELCLLGDTPVRRHLGMPFLDSSRGHYHSGFANGRIRPMINEPKPLSRYAFPNR